MFFILLKITATLQPFYGPFSVFQDHPGEPVPEENFWTLWCKGRLREVDTPTIRLGATSSGLNSAHLHHPPIIVKLNELYKFRHLYTVIKFGLVVASLSGAY